MIFDSLRYSPRRKLVSVMTALSLGLTSCNLGLIFDPFKESERVEQIRRAEQVKAVNTATWESALPQDCLDSLVQIDITSPEEIHGSGVVLDEFKLTDSQGQVFYGARLY